MYFFEIASGFGMPRIYVSSYMRMLEDMPKTREKSLSALDDVNKSLFWRTAVAIFA